MVLIANRLMKVFNINLPPLVILWSVTKTNLDNDS